MVNVNVVLDLIYWESLGQVRCKFYTQFIWIIYLLEQKQPAFLQIYQICKYHSLSILHIFQNFESRIVTFPVWIHIIPLHVLQQALTD